MKNTLFPQESSINIEYTIKSFFGNLLFYKPNTKTIDKPNKQETTT